MSSNKRPVHEIRLGLVKAAIWENPSKDGVFYSVRFQRNYKDGTDWKSTDNFNRDDLLLLAKTADRAHTWIHEQRVSSGERQREQRP